MPHRRKRHILPQLVQLSRFWPVVGVLGLRQSGKTTLLRSLLGIGNSHTLDDEDTLEDVQLSAKNFLLKVGRPVAIDEAQKVPRLFDAIKLLVDESRRPGSFYLTGSSQFSSKLGIRESLTGRIGIIHLYPFTLAEAYEKDSPSAAGSVRFKVADVLAQLPMGGLPVPLFTRSSGHQVSYFKNWMETSILRDAARAYGREYNPDVAWSLLRQMGAALRNGELVSLKHFKQSSRVVRPYMNALEAIFILRKIPCHEAGTGQDVWMVTDSGLAREIMGTSVGEGATLTLARSFVLNEIIANAEYRGASIRPLYFKTARGNPVDLVLEDQVISISLNSRSQIAYDERTIRSALKHLQLSKAMISVPRDEVHDLNSEIKVVPWTWWS